MTTELRVRYRPKGGALALFNAREREIAIEGPAGTGKTRAVLELIHLLCHSYSGLRCLIVRKHAVTLTTTALATFNEEVLKPEDGVRFFGGSRTEPASYRYPNGSRIVVGGMGDGKDAVAKILSSRYDIIYPNEAPELNIEEWETLTTRLRQPEKPAQRADGQEFLYQRIMGDLNPTFEKHWLYKRIDEGKTRLIVSRFQDNPAYFDDEGEPTQAGAAYLAGLDALTGTRYQRLRLGLRVGVENAIYPHFDRNIHIIELPSSVRFTDGAFGGDYGRKHKAAVTPISVDQWGRRWVRESWAEPDSDHGRMTAKEIGRQYRQYALRRGRVDPNQDVLIGLLWDSIKTAKLAEGSRQSRIDKTGRLLGIFPGGRVPSYKEEFKYGFVAKGPFPEPDSPGLLFVKGAPGIEELADEIESYHYVRRSTDITEEDVVARIDEDRVASMEYAIEELEEPPAMPPMAPRASATSYREPQTYRRETPVKAGRA